MGFLDWLTGKIECPRCGTGGAREVNGQILCTNPTCAYFSKGTNQNSANPGQTPESFVEPVSVPPGSVAIQYVDFRGKPRTFVAEAASARRVKNHLSVKVGTNTRRKVTVRNPQTGEPMKVFKEVRIVLSRDRIRNLAEIEGAIPQRIQPGQAWPTPRQRQVLTYHQKHQSTSPLYESIREKYPNW
jgi:hypothetical protein